MSVFDDGDDLMIPSETRGFAAVPVEETRGGENPDWEHAKPGEPLPELEEGE